MEKELVIASNNQDKLKEYQEMLSPLGYKLYSLKDLKIISDPVENGTSYQENALIKAKAVSALTAMPVIADDSGIEFPALGGFPGIHTARYAKSIGGYPKAFVDLNERLIGKSKVAVYHCCICLLSSKESKPHYFLGTCEGSLLSSPKGHNGFGYDPIFHFDKGNFNFGEVDEDTKNAVSHRHNALVALVNYLSKNSEK
jgi:XTP/dITP diphosphohydrolase